MTKAPHSGSNVARTPVRRPARSGRPRQIVGRGAVGPPAQHRSSGARWACSDPEPTRAHPMPDHQECWPAPPSSCLKRIPRRKRGFDGDMTAPHPAATSRRRNPFDGKELSARPANPRPGDVEAAPTRWTVRVALRCRRVGATAGEAAVRLNDYDDSCIMRGRNGTGRSRWLLSRCGYSCGARRAFGGRCARPTATVQIQLAMILMLSSSCCSGNERPSSQRQRCLLNTRTRHCRTRDAAGRGQVPHHARPTKATHHVVIMVVRDDGSNDRPLYTAPHSETQFGTCDPCRVPVRVKRINSKIGSSHEWQRRRSYLILC
jgi:hypothetical protein